MLEKVKALAAVADVTSTDSDGNTCLHNAKTPATIRALLEAGGSNPRRVKNKDGKTAFEVQTPENRQAISDFVLFCGRFDVASLSAPEHATATSVVLRATDTFAPEEGSEGDGVEEVKAADGEKTNELSRDVVIKLMKEEEVFERELAQRKGTDSAYVIQIVCHSQDDDMKQKWSEELKKLGRWRSYTFGIVMPCAQRNLMVRALSSLIILFTYNLTHVHFN